MADKKSTVALCLTRQVDAVEPSQPYRSANSPAVRHSASVASSVMKLAPLLLEFALCCRELGGRQRALAPEPRRPPRCRATGGALPRGALTAIHPSEQEEAARDLLRCREDIRTDLLERSFHI